MDCIREALIQCLLQEKDRVREGLPGCSRQGEMRSVLGQCYQWRSGCVPPDNLRIARGPVSVWFFTVTDASQVIRSGKKFSATAQYMQVTACHRSVFVFSHCVPHAFVGWTNGVVSLSHVSSPPCLHAWGTEYACFYACSTTEQCTPLLRWWLGAVAAHSAQCLMH